MWERSRPAFACGNSHRRARKLGLAALACLGRHTLSGMICTSAEQFRDWSADYRLVGQARFDREKLFGAVVDEMQSMIEPGQPLEVAVDDTSLRKSGRKVSGAQWRPDRMGPKFQVNLIWAQRFLQISMALPEQAQTASAACMVPVEFLHCPNVPKPPKDATAQQLAEYRSQARQASLPVRAVAALEALSARVGDQRTIICSGDGGYTNRSVLKALPPRMTFIGRIRKDAKLFAPPVEQNQMGRRRVYGEQLPTPDQIRSDEAIAWQSIQVYVGGQMRSVDVKTMTVRWKPAGAQDLKLIVIRPLKYKLTKNGRTWYRDPVYLIATDTTIATQQLVQSYTRRWGIEQNFRDEKQVLGIGQSYVRTPQSVQALPALLVATYAMLRLACVKTSDIKRTKPKWQRSTAKHYLTANDEIAALRNALWGQALRTADPSFNGFASTHATNTKPPKIQNTLASAVIYASRC